MPTPERHLADWLPDTTPAIHAAIVRRALLDVGICEIPPGSNRSPRIDEYCRDAGSPVGSYWCACAVTAWLREAGAAVPPHDAGSCDEWWHWGLTTGRITHEPIPGAVVLYGTPEDATHIGVVVRTAPLLLSVEGNTSIDGHSRNGVAVDLKLVNTDRLLAYLHPEPLS